MKSSFKRHRSLSIAGRDSKPNTLANHSECDLKTQETMPGVLDDLKQEILRITHKIDTNTHLLGDEESQNRVLTEKLLALEIAVQNLYENAATRRVGCCSSYCDIF